MNKIKILWADDEIDLLKPQIMFLEEKGYDVTPVTNGQDAIDKVGSEAYDLVFLDEQMPGLSGLETLPKIKSKSPGVPVVLITRNEEENIMEEAIGSQISDYLIKPVKSNQILLTIKKLIDNKRLVSQKTSSAYQQEFQKIFMSFQEEMDYPRWVEVYKNLVYWELELDRSNREMQDVLTMQKHEANVEFNKFVIKNYIQWLDNEDAPESPAMSHNVLKRMVFPLIDEKKPTFIVLIDNLRFDQWRTIQPIISENFKFVKEDTFMSILPTATQYSRNSIFAGMMPVEIEEEFRGMWKNDEDEGGKNMFEDKFLASNIKNSFRDELKHEYIKITNHSNGRELEDNILNYMNNSLVVIVYNFIDMLSHARTEMEVLKELANDESAYRSLTLSWFKHSPLHNALLKLADKDVNLVIMTDHGSIRVSQPSKCIGDRTTTTNIRYKNGKNLNFNAKDVFEITDPHDAYLPKPHISSSYIFAREENFFVYPNNYNYYVNYFKDTFQHGGVSLEEMIIPIAFYTSR